MVIRMNIFVRIKEERERLGLNQESFGSVGGVKKLAQFNYESGKRVPDAVYLENLSKIGVDVNYILTGVRIGDIPTLLPADEQVLLSSYRAAPVPVRNAALAVLLSGGHAPEGVDTSKERKGRAAPKKVMVKGINQGVVAGGDVKIGDK